VGRGLPARLHARAEGVRGGDQLGTGRRLRGLGQHLDQRGKGALAGGVVQPELCAAPPAAPLRRRAEQGDDPGHVLGGQRVQGAAQRPGADHAALHVGRLPDVGRGEPGAAGADLQPRCAQILRLQPAGGAHHRVHVGRARRQQPLCAHP